MKFFNERKLILKYSFLALFFPSLLHFSFCLLSERFSKCNSHIVLASSSRVSFQQHSFHVLSYNVLFEFEVSRLLIFLLSPPLFNLLKLGFLHHFLLSRPALGIIISSIGNRKACTLRDSGMYWLKETVHRRLLIKIVIGSRR